MNKLQQFEVGNTYVGWAPGLGPDPSITITARESGKYRTACGRLLKPVLGLGPQGDIEVLRVDCDGVVARGGVFRPDGLVERGGAA